jgi:hypothetical protein
VDKIGDASNLEWAERFTADMDAPTRECVERYWAAIPAPVGGDGALGTTGEGEKSLPDAAFSVPPVRCIDRTGAVAIWSRSKNARATPHPGNGPLARAGGKPSPPSAGGKRVFEWKKELREISARMEDLRRLLARGLEEGRATGAAIRADNQTLRDLRPTEDPRQLLARGLEEGRATRAVIQADNETLRDLRLVIDERQKSLQSLRDAMAAVRQEREVLEIRRGRLKTLIDMPPTPDDGAP